VEGGAVRELERVIGQSMFSESDGIRFGRDRNGDFKPIFYQPRPQPVYLHTLTGFVDYIKSDVDKVILQNCLIVVESPFEVSLRSELYGVDRGRDVYAAATVDRNLETYSFGSYMEVESFIVSLNALFEETEDRGKIARYVSRIRGGTTFELSDDGVTQLASVSKGVSGALTEQESAPAVVSLRPYRTFRDIEQPLGEFLFRLKLMKESIVGACLYEADGGRWRNTAVLGIRDWLSKELHGSEVPIIA
jgi:hypothetical protein